MNKRDDLLKDIAHGLETLAGRITVALATHDTPGPDIEATLRERYPGACLAACDVVTGCSSRITVPSTPELGGFCGRSRVCPSYALLELARGTVAASGETFVECRNLPCSDHEDGDLCGKNSPTCPNRITGTEPYRDGAIEDDACRVECANTKCEFIDADDNTCLALKSCESLISPYTCEPHAAPADPELLQGYTLAQWDEIREGGYLCEFSDEGGPWALAPMLEAAINVGHARPFTSFFKRQYEFCRPAQLPGILRPWFGGECPVADDAKVLVVFRNGEALVLIGGSLSWEHNGSFVAALRTEITAYMEV